MTIAETATDRVATIAALKAALKRRSGKTWSVTGGRGTAWGWLTIHVPPSRRAEFGYITETERAELAALLGLPSVHSQGVSIAASSAYRREYLERAEGVPVTAVAEPYWD
jgi:hypothetical protein